MSQSVSKNIRIKNLQQNINNSKLFADDLIQYSDKIKDPELFMAMRDGYIDMGVINLNIALESESELFDVNNYETWLCGV